jgi:DNA polymerase-3 subunit epsilon
MEPSYYSWMMQGDFPLYTKRKLEEIYNRWNTKKAAERQPKPAPQKQADRGPAETGQKENPAKKEFQKPQSPQNNHHQSRPENRPYKKNDEPAKPVNDDMLKMLAEKFKKG